MKSIRDLTDKQLAGRILLTGLVLTLGAMPLGCSLIWPAEHGPSKEILASRYVSEEQRQAVAGLHTKEMDAAIAEARAQ